MKSCWLEAELRLQRFKRSWLHKTRKNFQISDPIAQELSRNAQGFEMHLFESQQLKKTKKLTDNCGACQI
jgi:hypothetical protein